MARRKSRDEEVRDTNRKMTPSERQAEDAGGLDRQAAETLHMPRPGTGALLTGAARPRQESETARAAERAARRDGRKQ